MSSWQMSYLIRDYSFLSTDSVSNLWLLQGQTSS